jgi:hypothetical protein
MASTSGSLRQRLALRSTSARLSAHSAWLQAATPLGQNLLGGCAGPPSGPQALPRADSSAQYL